MSFEMILSILLGLGLSSAVGFRIFVPALITSVAAHFDYLQLADAMSWMGTIPAMITFGVATLAEIGAYYIPFVDNLMDTVATPAAAICGTLLMGSTIVEMEPMIKWPISVIAGGGLATTIQSGTSIVRATSSGVTAGMGNPIVSSVEGILSVIMSIVSILLPILAGVAVLFFVILIVRRKRKNKLA